MDKATNIIMGRPFLNLLTKVSRPTYYTRKLDKLLLPNQQILGAPDVPTYLVKDDLGPKRRRVH
jgi:hypothetical protein